MKEVVIAGCCRTPIGVHGGAIKDLPAQRLAEIVFRETLSRTKLDPALLDEVILGCIAQPSEAAKIATARAPPVSPTASRAAIRTCGAASSRARAARAGKASA